MLFACGTCAFSRFYLDQPFLPTWILAALAWWTLSQAYRRRVGIIRSREFILDLAFLSLALALGVALLGPIPFYIFLCVWLFRWLPRDYSEPKLRVLHWLFAVTLLTSYGWATYKDWQDPSRQLGRVIGPHRLHNLSKLVKEQQVTPEQLQHWATHSRGRARENAIRALAYCHQPQCQQTLQRLAAQEPVPEFRKAAQETLALVEQSQRPRLH